MSILTEILYDDFEIDNIFASLIGLDEVTTIDELYALNIYTETVELSKKRKKLMLENKSAVSFGICKRCKSDNCSLVETQSRSADEAKDFIIICNKCGFKTHAS